MEQQVFGSEIPFQPAVRYIFFFQTKPHRFLKPVRFPQPEKGCRSHRGYVEDLSSYQRQRKKNP